MLSDKILTIKPYDASGTHKYLDGTIQVDTYKDRDILGSNLWETSNLRSWLSSTETSGNVTWLCGSPPSINHVQNKNNAYDMEKGFLAEGNFTPFELNTIKSVTQKSILNPLDKEKLRTFGNASHTMSENYPYILENYFVAYCDNITDKMFILDIKQLYSLYPNREILGYSYFQAYPTQKAIDNSMSKSSSISGGFQTDKYLESWTRTPCTYLNRGEETRVVSQQNYGSVISVFSCNSSIGVRPAFYMNLSTAISTVGDGSINNPFVATSFATPDPTPIPTPTPVATQTPTLTPTLEPTQTPTPTPTPTLEPTSTPTLEPTPSPISVTGINISQSTATIKLPLTLQLTATVIPDNALNKSLNWSSSNTRIAIVSQTGMVTAKGLGPATILVRNSTGAISASCKITIIEPVISVKINKTVLYIFKGKTFKLIPAINPVNASNKKVTWKSSNVLIATVSSSGVVKGIKKGMAYITVITIDEKKSARCKVVVK